MAFMAAAAPYMQYAGMAMSAVGAVQGSQANKAAYGAQAQVAANNAQIAQYQADDALTRGRVNASRMGMQVHQLKGQQRAKLAANGVDLGVGSALNILTDTDQFGEIDANTITDNAAKEAWAIRQQANGYTSDANLLKARADSEKPWMSGMTSLLTSAGRVAGNWYSPSTSGDGLGQGDRRRMGVY